MFSSTSEYALRAVVHLAANWGRACTAQEIATFTVIPRGYLSKVLQDLARAGIVTSQRGPHGGFTLGADPAQITVLRVVDCVDPIKRIERCPLSLAAHAHRLCRLHQMLDDAIGRVQETLAKTTIADLIDAGEEAPPCASRAPSESLTPLSVDRRTPARKRRAP